MDLSRTRRLLSRAALLADSARVRIERSASALRTPALARYRPEPTPPASVILLSRGPRGSAEQRDTVAPPPA
jgi:hypothetical protein